MPAIIPYAGEQDELGAAAGAGEHAGEHARSSPAASIWNGSHGPPPPVSAAEANMATLPSTNPNPGPITRPAGHEQEEHQLDAADARR